jgi:hypothetical protein
MVKQPTTDLSAPASDRIRRALYYATKQDYRTAQITQGEAVALLQAANEKNGYQGKTKTPPKGFGEAPMAKVASKPVVVKTDKTEVLKAGMKQALMWAVPELAAYFCELMGYKEVVMVDTKWLKDDGKRYVFRGGGCGFAFIRYRKSPKATMLHDYFKQIKREVDAAVLKALPPALVAECQADGNYIQAHLTQSELYNNKLAWVAAKYMESVGITNVWVESRAD